MSGARRSGTTGAIAELGRRATSSAVDTAGNGAGPPAPPAVVDEPDGQGPDPWAEVIRLRGELNAAQIAANDANRLLAEVKAQRNTAMDDIMLLRAQLKVAMEDGAAGWAAWAAASGQTH